MPATTLHLPPWTHTAEGRERRVGVEIEMIGLSLPQLAAIVAQIYHGRVSRRGRYELVIEGDAAGEWGAELDFNLLKKLGREQHDEATLEGLLSESSERLLAWAAESLVPVELVSPPLPLSRLDEVETLIHRLQAAGAKGCSDGLLNAFALQFNPEVPDTRVETLLAVFKAFLCLYDWIYKRADLDLTRRITSYVDPFPADYVRRVVDPSYWPDQQGFIADYLDANPTRNRVLDLLPLMRYLDEEQVMAVIDDELVKARPTFHYRLPNSEIHLPHWGLYQSWNDWVQAEWLAYDTERLNACCEAYSRFLHNPLRRWLGDWSEHLEREWLRP